VGALAASGGDLEEGEEGRERRESSREERGMTGRGSPFRVDSLCLRSNGCSFQLYKLPSFALNFFNSSRA